jgi:hypothetical protein
VDDLVQNGLIGTEHAVTIGRRKKENGKGTFREWP